jgi:hypothetical protein
MADDFVFLISACRVIIASSAARPASRVVKKLDRRTNL